MLGPERKLPQTASCRGAARAAGARTSRRTTPYAQFAATPLARPPLQPSRPSRRCSRSSGRRRAPGTRSLSSRRRRRLRRPERRRPCAHRLPLASPSILPYLPRPKARHRAPTRTSTTEQRSAPAWPRARTRTGRRSARTSSSTTLRRRGPSPTFTRTRATRPSPRTHTGSCRPRASPLTTRRRRARSATRTSRCVSRARSRTSCPSVAIVCVSSRAHRPLVRTHRGS